jgi:hypothetical protein
MKSDNALTVQETKPESPILEEKKKISVPPAVAVKPKPKPLPPQTKPRKKEKELTMPEKIEKPIAERVAVQTSVTMETKSVTMETIPVPVETVPAPVVTKPVAIETEPETNIPRTDSQSLAKPQTKPGKPNETSAGSEDGNRTPKPIPKPRSRTHSKDKGDFPQQLEDIKKISSSPPIATETPVAMETPIAMETSIAMETVTVVDVAMKEASNEQKVADRTTEMVMDQEKTAEEMTYESGEKDTGRNSTILKQVAYENVVLNIKDDGEVSLIAPQKYRNEADLAGTTAVTLPTEDQTNIEEKEELPLSTVDIGNNHIDIIDTSVTPPIIPPTTEDNTLTTDIQVANGTPPIYDETTMDDSTYDVPRIFSPTKDDDGIYDVPRSLPSSPSIDDIYDKPTVAKEFTPSEPHPPTTPQKTAEEVEYDVPVIIGSMTSTDEGSAISPTYSSYTGPPPERDPWGYAKIMKKSNQSQETEPNNVQDVLALHLHEDLQNVPENLQKAKEILRLAKVVQAEAEIMREEAEKELAIAKRERHDAELLKKNAAEILRMAKEKLNK